MSARFIASVIPMVQTVISRQRWAEGELMGEAENTSSISLVP